MVVFYIWLTVTMILLSFAIPVLWDIAADLIKDITNKKEKLK